MKDLILGKSSKNGSIPLFNHSIGVYNNALFVCDKIIKKDAIWQATISNPYNNEVFKQSVGRVALLHDIGKVCEKFQKMIKSKDNDEVVEEYPLSHNIISYSFLRNYYDIPSVSQIKNSELISILHHHTIHSSDTSLTTIDVCNEISKDIENMKEFALQLRDYTNTDFEITENQSIDITIGTVPLYQKIYNTNYDSLHSLYRDHLMRAILLYSDRNVSKHYKENELFFYNETDFMDGLLEEYSCSSATEKARKIDYYSIPTYDSVRLKNQDFILGEMLKNDNTILQAETGYGKTLLGFRWWAESNKKLIWLTPTQSIANSTYQSLSEIINVTNLKQDCSISLLIGGEYVEGEEGSDITVAVIDNFLNYNIKNNSAHLLLKTLYCDVVFDEYQECTTSEPMFASFVGMCGARLEFTNFRTLLLSATPPSYSYFRNIQTVNVGVYNKEKIISIKVEKLNDNKDAVINTPQQSLTITHSIKDAQDICEEYGKYDSTLLIHTQFPQTVYKNKIKEVLENCGPNSNEKERKVLFGTNVLGTGCNISAKIIREFPRAPHITIQSIGRGDRFTTNGGSMEYVAFYVNDKSVPEFIKCYFDNSKYGIEIWKRWKNVLMEYDGRTISNVELYQLLDKFYEDNKKTYKEYYDEMLIKSSSSYSVMTPKPNKKGRKTDRLHNGMTFRGQSNDIYVVAKREDGSMCEPIQIQAQKVIKLESESDGNSISKKIKYFEEHLQEKDLYRYKFKGRYSDKLNKDNWVKIAMNKETPLLLENSIYDEKLGLKIL